MRWQWQHASGREQIESEVVMEFDFSGRVSLITGSTRGIGRAMAGVLAQAGSDVVVTGRSSAEHPNTTFPGTIDSVAAELRKAGTRVLEIAADLSDPADVARVVDITLGEFGRCDVLVNNAAFTPSGPIATTPPSRWLTALRVNALAPLQLCQAFLPGMSARASGRILNVSSMASIVRIPDLAMYGSSKHCLEAMSQALAAAPEARGVAVNAVRVAAVATEMWHYTQQTGIGERQGTQDTPAYEPLSVAEALVRLLSEPAELTGRILSFDDLIEFGFLAPLG